MEDPHDYQLAVQLPVLSKRCIIDVMKLLVLVEATTTKERAEASLERGRSRASARALYIDRCCTFNDTEWIIIFRMSTRATELLYRALYPYLNVNLSDSNIAGRRNSNRNPLTVTEKLHLGLMVAGGSTIGGILHSFSISKCTCYNTIHRFFTAVILSEVGRIYMPDNASELKDLSDTFKEQKCYRPEFYGCVGALDGLAVRIILPSKRDFANPLLYPNRKGFPAINVQAIADGNARCRWLSVLSPGSTHDATAWVCSTFAQRWAQMNVTYPDNPDTKRLFWLAVDDAYGASKNMLCPWPGTGLRKRYQFKDAFNYFMSSTSRNVVERMFGQVYQRWGILWRPIRYPLRRAPMIILALFRLHNFLLDVKDSNDTMPSFNSGSGRRRFEEPRRTALTQSGYEHQHHQQDECSTEEPERPRTRTEQCPIRQAITDALEAGGVVRPGGGALEVDL